MVKGVGGDVLQGEKPRLFNNYLKLCLTSISSHSGVEGPYWIYPIGLNK